MPRARWPLRQWRPMVELTLPLAKGRRRRQLLADTGAGSGASNFELILREADCQRSPDNTVLGQVQLGRAYSGWFNVYTIAVRIPRLDFADSVPVVGVAQVPDGFDGIACFKFLNRFQYGNFGDAARFGLGS
jgi:hypothetical protein